MRSVLKEGSSISFPEFTKERAYMIPFKKSEKLPDKYSRWQDTINTMLDNVETDGVVYMTIDQGRVLKGDSQRRGSPHIDGNYSKINGYITLSSEVMAWGTGGGWSTKSLTKGGIILASNSVGCKAYEGEFDGVNAVGGDCSHLDLSSANVSILKPNRVYIGNVTMIHETIKAEQTHNRSFVRLTLPETYEFAA